MLSFYVTGKLKTESNLVRTLSLMTRDPEDLEWAENRYFSNSKITMSVDLLSQLISTCKKEFKPLEQLFLDAGLTLHAVKTESNA